MIVEMFRKPTKWSVMRHLIFKDIDDLIIRSLGIIAFISFFVGGVITIQTALNISNPLFQNIWWDLPQDNQLYWNLHQPLPL